MARTKYDVLFTGCVIRTLPLTLSYS